MGENKSQKNAGNMKDTKKKTILDNTHNDPVTIDKPLTKKEQEFVKYYIETGNGSESIIKAGYKVKTQATASVTANRLLKKANVANQIKEYMLQVQAESIATAQDVMEYFSKVMRGEILDQFGLEASLSERTKAATELAKRTVDIDNRLQGKTDNEITIKIDWKKE